MFITISELKNMYNICLPDNRINKSLLLAHDYFKRMVSTYHEAVISTQNVDRYVVSLPTRKFLFDTDYDWVNSNDDVEAFQYNQTTFEEQNISNLIESVKAFKQGSVHKLIVKFTTPVSTDSTLYPSLSFKYHLTPLDLNEKKYNWFIKDYIAMYTLYNLLNTSDVSKLQTGIASWNLNGVTVSVDSSTVRSVMDDIKKKLDTLYNEFMPIVSGAYEGDVDVPDRYFGYNSLSGGNSYTAINDRRRG